MQFSSLFVGACASWLPASLPLRDAVDNGWLTEAAADQVGLEAVTISEQEYPPQMASYAAGEALRRWGQSAKPVDLLLHSALYYQGQDFWPSASYVQRVALGYDCPSVEVRQMSNGGMAALELAAGYLAGDAQRHTALLTAADRFATPGFNRWTSDPGTVYADGAAALLLSNEHGFARLVSMVTVSDPDLEGMHRGADPFGDVPFSHRLPVDLDAHKRDFLSDFGLSPSISRVAAGQRRSIETSLAEAGLSLAQIDWFVLPNLGLRRLRNAYFEPFGIDPNRTTWSWLKQVGHLGPADQFAGLSALADGGRLRPGQHCMLLGVGAGFSWSCAVLEIVRLPAWAQRESIPTQS